jgi:4-amino-4-deoxy-L-arabinose transferase-like glycosyltransferase
MTAPKGRKLVFIACALLLLQALPYFQRRWVEDESWYSSTAYTFLHEGNFRNAIFPERDLESKADTRPLAMPVTLAAEFKLLGVNVAGARLAELLCALGLVVVVYRLGCAWGMPGTAAIAALLISVDNTVFLAARTVRPEAFVAFFGTLSVLFYFLSRQRQSVALAIACGLSLGIAFNYHVNGFGIAASIGLLLLGEFRWNIWREKRAWAIVLASAATLIPFVMWVNADPVHMAAFKHLYGRGQILTMASVARFEGIRYRDYLGFSNQRMHLFGGIIPLRAHVVVLYVVSLGVLAWKKRALFWTILALLIPSLLIWTKEVNPTLRFFAIVAPYLSLAVGAALGLINRPHWHRLLAALCILVVATQAGGNAILLIESRKADYSSVTRQLRALVPPEARVYGAITFFLALHDRVYYSWNRTPFDYAISRLHVNYLILNDRVLVGGSGIGLDDWKAIRERANEFVRTQADLIGRVPDPFYGDLEIYRVKAN